MMAIRIKVNFQLRGWKLFIIIFSFQFMMILNKRKVMMNFNTVSEIIKFLLTI